MNCSVVCTLVFINLFKFRYDFNNQQNRNLTKFSLKKGKRKTVKAVIDRFYRLGW